ncbi:MAG: ATP-binding cassette domain-containing protein [Alphaproteobacteria bacterium]|nr:ATP-binding cassette domain-containing protein [Alphaproteobacteria bacterium]
MKGPLLDRARAATGGGVDDLTLALIVDIVGQVLLLRRSRDLKDSERAWLVATLAERVGATTDQVAALVELVWVDRLRTTVRPDELRVMRAWFGERGTARATRDLVAATPPEQFAAEHGLDECLLLFDLLVQLALADGEVSPREVAALEHAAASLSIDPVFVSALLSRHDPRLLSTGRRAVLRGPRVRIGRAATNELVLPGPQVSARHAELLRDGDGWRIVQTGDRPVFIDDEAVRSFSLTAAHTARIGPYRLRLEGDEAVITDERRLSVLTVTDLSRTLGDRVLLDGVGFSAFTGEVIAVVGPSGAGKTTLLHAISGVVPPDRGEIRLDGEDFHARLVREPGLVADVPQDDLVLPELTVEESLRAAARLRLPRTAGLDELQASVDRVLDELGIADIRGQRVGDALRRGISGGQRKRVNVGQELVSRSTRLLFLDEPTSGLDPQAAHDLMQLVRRLADHGRIVFVVTHDLSPATLSQVDHLLVLAPGGRLAWFGPPDEAAGWFGVRTPGDLFDRLRDQSPVAWRDAFHGSPAWRRHVATRAHLAPSARAEPPPPRPRDALPTLLARYARVRLRDRTGAVVLIAQPVLLAAIMIAVFSHTTAPLLFMATLSCLWFGMSGAVRELIVDRPVWRRERRVGVGVGAWLGSKVLVLAVLHAVQAAAMLTVVHAAIGMGDAGVRLPVLIGTGVLTAWAGMTMGLLVGGLWGRSEAAVGTLVLLLVPQIAFSGVLTPLSEVSAPAQAAAAVTVERYALHAAVQGADTIAYRSPVRGWQEQPARGAAFNLGLRPGDGEGLSRGQLWGVLLGFSAVQLLATALVVARKD